MQLTEIWKTLSNEFIIDWKNQGKKIIGYYCTSVPQEIIHAGKMLPFRIRGTECTDTALADSILSKLNCSFVRCSLNLAMKGKYDFLDGVADSNQCDHARRMYDIWKIKLAKDRPNFYLGYLSVPHLISDDGAKWFKDEILNFKKSLENHFNIKIEDNDILNSIKVYNETRKLLGKLHEYRSLEKPKITSKELAKVMVSGLSIPREKFLELLNDFVEEVGSREGKSDYRARLILIGSEIDNPEFYNIFEDLNAIIVSDSLCMGTRNYLELVPENDPIEGLVDYYYKKLLCPRMMDSFANRRLKFVKEQVEKTKAQGVVVQRIEFCDLHGVDNMLYQHKLEEAGIPVLNLDREYMLGDTARFKTRVEAFLEQIEFVSR